MADEAQKVEGEEKALAEQKPQTIAEALNTQEPEAPKTVPEAAFLEEKKARKALEKELKTLKATIDSGASHQEVSEDIEAIASEYDGVDKNFLNKYAAAVEAKAVKKAQALIDEKLQPLETERKQQQIDKVFKSHFAKAMDELPQYEGVVNEEVIKALSLLPQNSSKTFAQLIEETYSGAIRGKRTLETTVPRGGAASGTFDPERANSDVTYLREVLADPQMKKQYDEHREKTRRS